MKGFIITAFLAIILQLSLASTQTYFVTQVYPQNSNCNEGLVSVTITQSNVCYVDQGYANYMTCDSQKYTASQFSCNSTDLSCEECYPTDVALYSCFFGTQSKCVNEVPKVNTTNVLHSQIFATGSQDCKGEVAIDSYTYTNNCYYSEAKFTYTYCDSSSYYEMECDDSMCKSCSPKSKNSLGCNDNILYSCNA